MVGKLLAGLAGVAPSLAPAIGALDVMAASQISLSAGDQTSGTWIWRTVLTAGISVFVVLCGVIYRDVGRRITETDEQAQRNVDRLADQMGRLAERQQRMLGVMLVLAIAVKQADQDNTKVFELLQQVMEK